MRPELRTLKARRAGPESDAVAPDGSQIRFLIGDSDEVERASAVEVVLEPGKISRPVRHRTVEEIWYVLAGAGRVWRDPPGDSGFRESVVEVSPGDALAIPLGWAFQFAADGAEPLLFLCFTSPPWPGDGEAITVNDGGLGPPSL